mgnify:FL=1
MTSNVSSSPSPVALLSLNFGDESEEFPLLSPVANLNYLSSQLILFELNAIRRKEAKINILLVHVYHNFKLIKKTN